MRRPQFGVKVTGIRQELTPLFVGSAITRWYERQQFALALRQQAVPCTLLGDLRLLFSIYRVELDRLMNRVEQRLVAKRFGQKLSRAGLHCLYRHQDSQ
jgi:hypothetical protein